MTLTVPLNDLDLAALISSRICHDAIGPVGAITNGLEVLNEDPDDSMKEFAMDTIRKSANSASSKLQFARLAFGAAGSVGSQIAMHDVEAVSKAFIEQGRHKLAWSTSKPEAPKQVVKLLMNMLTIAQTVLPRGGEIHFVMDQPDNSFKILCEGTRILIPEHMAGLLSGTSAELDSHSIQPYYTGRIAAELGMQLKIQQTGDNTVELTAA